MARKYGIDMVFGEQPQSLGTIAINTGHLIISQFPRAPLKNAEERCDARFFLQFLEEQLLLAMNPFNRKTHDLLS